MLLQSKLIILNCKCDSWTFYQSNAETVAELLNEQNVPVISPLSKDVGNPFNNLYQTIPASEVIKKQCLNTRARNGNIIAVVDKKESIVRYIKEYQKIFHL
jgi:hypothetical protein